MNQFAVRTIFLASFFGALLCAQPAGPDQTPSTGVVIRSETRQVLVDAVVTDKKGYVEGLQAKDFKVYEDNKEQPIKSFSYEADPASPAHSLKHYLVLLYDQCHLAFEDQARAREAAMKFVSANAGNNRPMTVIRFRGGMDVLQDFTEDTDKLNKVVASLSGPNVGPDAAGCHGDVPKIFFDGLVSLARSLTSIPGRKTLVLISGGFVAGDMLHSLATVAIDASNKANVAIYPIDIRGVSTLGLGMPAPHALLQPRPAGPQAFLKQAAYRPSESGMAFAPQRGGTGPAGGGGGRGASPAPAPAPSGGGGRGGGAPAPVPGRSPAPAPSQGGARGPAAGPGAGNAGRGQFPANGTFPQRMPGQSTTLRSINPPLPATAVDNQQVLYMLAQGTGGFVIADNDVLGGMMKISKEQDQYYLLGYTPTDDEPGVCHTIKVKVSKGEVRSRTGYCNVKPHDLLSGNPIEQTLEAKAAAAQSGSIPATLQVPYFYTGHNLARVEVAMDIDPSSLKFEKQKIKNKETGKEENKLRATINVLGIASNQQGAVAARFSDALNLDFDNEKEVKEFQAKPFHYENQFDVASGRYNLKVVFNSGSDQFGKLEAPLFVDPYDPSDFALSGLALTRESHPVAQMGLGLDALMLEDKKPLIAEGMQFVPAGSNKLSKEQPVAVYFEIYEPLLEKADPKTWVAIRLVVEDIKSGTPKTDSGAIKLRLPPSGSGNMISRAYSFPIEKLDKGTYRAVLVAGDSNNHEIQHAVEFEVQ